MKNNETKINSEYLTKKDFDKYIRIYKPTTVKFITWNDFDYEGNDAKYIDVFFMEKDETIFCSDYYQDSKTLEQKELTELHKKWLTKIKRWLKNHDIKLVIDELNV